MTHVKETKSKDFICQVTGYPQPITTWFAKKENGTRSTQQKLTTLDLEDFAELLEVFKDEGNDPEECCVPKGTILILNKLFTLKFFSLKVIKLCL